MSPDRYRERPESISDGNAYGTTADSSIGDWAFIDCPPKSVSVEMDASLTSDVVCVRMACCLVAWEESTSIVSSIDCSCDVLKGVQYMTP